MFPANICTFLTGSLEESLQENEASSLPDSTNIATSLPTHSLELGRDVCLGLETRARAYTHVGYKAAPHMCGAEVASFVVKSPDGFGDRIKRELRD